MKRYTKKITLIIGRPLDRKSFFIIHAILAVISSLIIMHVLVGAQVPTPKIYTLTSQIVGFSIFSLGFLPTVVLFLGHNNIAPGNLITITVTTVIYSMLTIFLIVQRLRHIRYNKLDIYFLFIVSPFIPVLDTFASFYLFLKEGKKGE